MFLTPINVSFKNISSIEDIKTTTKKCDSLLDSAPFETGRWGKCPYWQILQNSIKRCNPLPASRHSTASAPLPSEQKPPPLQELPWLGRP